MSKRLITGVVIVVLLMFMTILGFDALHRWGWPGYLILCGTAATAIYITFWAYAWTELVEHVERMRLERK